MTKGLTTDEREILRWLKERLRNSDRKAKREARVGNYDLAASCSAHASAYSYTIIWIEARAKRRSLSSQ